MGGSVVTSHAGHAGVGVPMHNLPRTSPPAPMFPPAPPLTPPTPYPPAPNEIPHLIMGSLWYTVVFNLGIAAPLLILFFFSRLDAYSWRATPGAPLRRCVRASFLSKKMCALYSRAHNGDGGCDCNRGGGSFESRVRQLYAVWSTPDAEVAARCGADARDYLVVQKLCLVAMTIIAVPGVCILMPVAMRLGAEDATLVGNSFAQTTVRAARPTPLYVYLPVIVSPHHRFIVSLCARCITCRINRIIFGSWC